LSNNREQRNVKIDGLLLDIDGVLTTRLSPIPGAPAALADLRRRGMPFRLLTNITMRSRAEVAAGLQRAGFAIESSEIFTAASLAAHYLRAHGGPRSWVLLHGSACEDFAGLDLGEAGAEYVVLGDLGDAFDAGIMNRIYRALLAGARLIAVQHNRAWIAADGPRLDVGAWVAALEFASGRPALVVGKPSPLAYQMPAADLGLPLDRLAMLSDDPDVDLAGARAAGLRTIFVRTSAVPGRRPVAADEFDYTLDSIADLSAILQ